MTARAPLCLVACRDGQDLARAVAARLGCAVAPSHEEWFACGEAKHVVEANVRGCDVYVFQRPIGPGRSVYDRTMALLHAVDALRHADAGRVTVVIPYLPGSRQDKRKNHVREGVSTGLLARMCTAAGVDMVITVEPHNAAIFGAYDPSRCVFEAISVGGPFAAFLERSGLVCDVVASTDVGGLEMARNYAKRLNRPIAALSKERDYSRPHVVVNTTVIGEVQGRSVLIVDDIVDTAGSITQTADALAAAGARRVLGAVTHPVLSGPALKRIEESSLELMIVTDTIPLRSNAGPVTKIAVSTIAPVLGEAIRRIHNEESVSSLFV